MLKAAEKPGLVHLFARAGERLGLARRFVAGENVWAALQAVTELNQQQIRASLDLLGEGVTQPSEAARARGAYVQVLEAIRERNVRSNISIKLTQLGLDISLEECRKNLWQILEKAEELDNFVRIDMEGSRYTDQTVSLFRQAFESFGRHVGIVIQAYLFRSEKDVAELSRLGCNIRLCKGAYQEPPELAYQEKTEVDQSFLRLLETLLLSGAYTAIASHDHHMVEHARKFIREKGISLKRYEYQMLYGVRREYQLELRDAGYPVRVYVPFGTQWAPYFMRRLAERPANLLFAARALFRG